MRELIRVSPEICAKCKYHFPFGANPGHRECINRNIACNYKSITGHSRIFENGKMAYDPEFCDKFEQGEKLPDSGEWSGFKIGDKPVDPFDEYKMDKIMKEKSKYAYKERKAREARTGKRGYVQ